MEHGTRASHTLWYEMFGFGGLIAMYWIVELVDVPGGILGT